MAWPSTIQARDLVKAMFTEMAAATLTPPSEVEADDPPLFVPLPVPPADVDLPFALVRSPATFWSTPSLGSLPSSFGAPLALAFVATLVFDEPYARTLTAPPALTLR